MTKKKNDVPENILQFMHPELPFDDKSLEDPKKPNSNTPDYNAQFAELSANLKRLEEANQNLQRTNMALMGQPVAIQPQFGSTEVNYDNLPDPVTNPKEYAQTLVQRANTAMEAQRQRENWELQQRRETESRVNNIWEQFGAAHPGLADKAELIESAATKAVAQAKAAGMDPNKYMFANTTGFFNDTVKILADWGIKETAAEDDDTNTPAQRTSGIPGGLESGGALTKGKDPDEVRIPTLMDEVKEWKLKTGFYA